jgi:ribosomal-protein-alanine N-acetyltransferase
MPNQYPHMNLPPYQDFPTLKNSMILLREIRPEDIKDLVEISFYDGKAASDEEEAKFMQARIDADYQRGDSIHWGIVDLEMDQVVGTCGYYRGFEGGSGELGCVLKPAFRGQGYMRTALELAIEFGFQQIGLEKVVAITSQQNEKAVRLLTRLQFVKTANLSDGEVEYQYLRKI